MRIALDVLGGDFGIEPNIQGAIKALEEFGYDIILVGDEPAIKARLDELGYSDNKKIEIVHAPELVDMDADTAKEVRSKKNASIVVAADLVGKGKADAFVSAGNSGASMIAALFKIGRVKWVERPAIGAVIPSVNGRYLLLDAGANADCSPIHLLQFAVMGSAYMQKLYKMDKPTVGLLSIGEEETKGNKLVKKTFPSMKKLDLNFYGMVEGRDLPMGKTDVVVTDGFTGNICLKLSEGLARQIFTMIKNNIKGKPLAMGGMMLAKSALMKIKDATDPDETGGAPLLGIDGVSVICHGKSSSVGIYNAIKIAGTLVKSKFIETIRESIAAQKEIFDSLDEEESNC
ncbi:glycerol-3-phosphate acyltransferase PlsX [Parelusimicrobium proximum]|uniref:phosphate acyltransferase PlsX n=1 Tax=Parelusimicrobium proximum TaxID=3228953 RepID=UPI003D174E0E